MIILCVTVLGSKKETCRRGKTWDTEERIKIEQKEKGNSTGLWHTRCRGRY